MGAYAYDGAAQQAGVLRAYDGAAWTGDADNGYVWNGTEWVLFQPVARDLLAPENFTANPVGDFEAAFTWTNPAQTPTPTHVQFRIPDLTGVWTEFDYPTVSTVIAYLNHSTTYQAQVRYIVREDGDITLTGAIAELWFTTTAPDGPGMPAADPGGSGGDSLIFWPDTVGTPGTVGSGGCWWEYVVQEPEQPLAVGTVSWVDTAVTAEIDGDIGDLAIDFIAEGFSCGDMLRLKYREVCNSVPGDWEYGGAFFAPCDWAADCGGISDSGSWAVSPYLSADDCIMALPQVCLDTGVEVIEDFITKQNFPRMSGLYLPVFTDGEWELRASFGAATNGEGLIAGYNTNFASIDETTDFSTTIALYVSTQPDLGTGVKVLELGEDLRIYIRRTGSGWYPYVTMSKTGGGQFVLTDATELSLNTWIMVTVTVDQNGDKLLYVDGIEVDSDTTGVACDWAGSGFNAKVNVNGNSLLRTRTIAAWNRVLSASEVGTLSPWPQPVPVGSEYTLSVAAGSNSTLDVTVPAAGSLEAGDVAILVTNVNASILFSGSGWTNVGEILSNRQVLYRVLAGNETGTFPQLTRANNNVHDGVCTVWRGLDTTAPVEANYARTLTAQFVEDDYIFDQFADPTANGGIQWGVCTTQSGTGTPQATGNGLGVKKSGWDDVVAPTTRQIQVWRPRIFPATTDTPWIDNTGNNWYINNTIGTGSFARYFDTMTLKPAVAYTGGGTSNITFVGVQTATGTSATPTVSLPAGTAEGDYVLLHITMGVAFGGSDEVDQTFLQDHRIQDNGNPRASFFAGAIIEGAPPASITITNSGGSAGWRASALVYRGVDPYVPHDFYGMTSTRDVVSAGDTQPGHTTKFDGSLVLSVCGGYRSFSSGTVVGSITATSGYTERVARLGSSGPAGTHDGFVYEYQQSTAGAVPQMTLGSGSSSIQWLTLALRGIKTSPA